MILAVALLTSVGAKAQFENGKFFVGADVSGLNMAYNGINKFQFGVGGKVGFFFWDNLLLYGQANYQHYGKDLDDYFSCGGGGRYYIIQNGLYLGASANYVHAFSGWNDFMPEVEVGYAFFLSRTVTIEPAIYYQQSFKDHSNYSTIGLRVGFGLYLFKD